MSIQSIVIYSDRCEFFNFFRKWYVTSVFNIRVTYRFANYFAEVEVPTQKKKTISSRDRLKIVAKMKFCFVFFHPINAK